MTSARGRARDRRDRRRDADGAAARRLKRRVFWSAPPPVPPLGAPGVEVARLTVLAEQAGECIATAHLPEQATIRDIGLPVYFCDPRSPWQRWEKI